MAGWRLATGHRHRRVEPAGIAWISHQVADFLARQTGAGSTGNPYEGGAVVGAAVKALGRGESKISGELRGHQHDIAVAQRRGDDAADALAGEGVPSEHGPVGAAVRGARQADAGAAVREETARPAG